MNGKSGLRAEDGKVFFCGTVISVEDAELLGKAVLRVAKEARAQGAAVAEAAAERTRAKVAALEAELAKLKSSDAASG